MNDSACSTDWADLLATALVGGLYAALLSAALHFAAAGIGIM